MTRLTVGAKRFTVAPRNAAPELGMGAFYDCGWERIRSGSGLAIQSRAAKAATKTGMKIYSRKGAEDAKGYRTLQCF